MSTGDTLFAAAHLDAEVLSALLRVSRHDDAMAHAVPAALRHLAQIAIRRMHLAPLLERMWELRHNVTPNDAAYVALAEGLSCPLVTCDAKLAGATGTRCDIELIG